MKTAGLSPHERSLALHALVAHELLADDRHLEAARARVRLWLETGRGAHPVHARRWLEILTGSPADVARFLVEESEEAATLRGVSPFAGVVCFAERWLFLRELGS